jgi:hypothetical protein
VGGKVGEDRRPRAKRVNPTIRTLGEVSEFAGFVTFL